jgi:phosphate transport system protein
MTQNLQATVAQLKESLLVMASRAEQAAQRAVKALLRRDDALALQVQEADPAVDQLQVQVDQLAVELLGRTRAEDDLRLVMVAMKIASELERVADEATTIARQVSQLNKEPPLPQCAAIPPLASLALGMLKEALDAVVRPNPAGARQIIVRDKAVDSGHKQLRDELVRYMQSRPETIARCLHLMVIGKSLERIGDHAKAVAEFAVYLHEGQDVRHAGLAQPAQCPG